MAKIVANIMVLGIWTYLRYLQLGNHFSLEQYHLIEFTDVLDLYMVCLFELLTATLNDSETVLGKYCG